MLKIFLALAAINVRLNTAVGNKSLSVLLEKLKSFGLLVCFTIVYMFKYFLEGHIIKATFFKNLAYEIQADHSYFSNGNEGLYL